MKEYIEIDTEGEYCGEKCQFLIDGKCMLFCEYLGSSDNPMRSDMCVKTETLKQDEIG